MANLMIAFVDKDLSTPEVFLHLSQLFSRITGTGINDIKVGSVVIQSLVKEFLEEDQIFGEVIEVDYFKAILYTEDYDILSPMYEIIRAIFPMPLEHYGEHINMYKTVRNELERNSFLQFVPIKDMLSTYTPLFCEDITVETFARIHLAKQLME